VSVGRHDCTGTYVPDNPTGLSFVSRSTECQVAIQSLLPTPAKFKILNGTSRVCNFEGFLQTCIDVVAH
jgi:hypothetical protein